MRTKPLFILLVLSAFLLPNFSHAWTSGYQYRQPIDVSTANASLTNYQIWYNVTYDAHMNPDFSDLYFTDEADVPYYFWVEDYAAGQWAFVWVKGTFTNANGTQAYMYYGNWTPTTSKGDPENTFAVYDNFTDGAKGCTSSGTGTWTISNGWLNGGGSSNTNLFCTYDGAASMSDARVVTYLNTNNTIFDHDASGILNRWTSSSQFYAGWVSSDDDIARIYKFETIVFTDTYTSIDNEYLRIEMINNQTEHRLYVNRSFVGGGTEATWRYGYIGFWTYEDNVSYRYIFATQYIHPEPTVSFGAAEEYGSTTVNITSPSNTTYWASNILYNYSARDSASGTFSVTHYIDGTPTANTSYVNGTWTSGTPSWDVGAHNFTVWANGFANTSETVIFEVEDFAEGPMHYTGSAMMLTNYSFINTWRYNPDIITMNATFYYNGTAYTSNANSNGSYYNFTSYKVTPSVSADTNLTFYFTVNVTFTNGTSVLVNSTPYNQTVSTIQLSDTGTAPTLNITMRDEQTRALINASAELLFMAYEGASNFTFNFTNLTYYTLYIVPPTASINNVDGQAVYYATGYSQRSYYWDINFTNATQTSDLYLLADTESTGVTFTVYDQNLIRVSGAIIKLERWYPASNSYQYVAMERTDSNGQAYIYLELYDAYYKVTVEVSGAVVYSQDKQRFYSSTHIIQFTSSSGLGYQDFLGSVSYNDSLVGQVYSVSVNDRSGAMTSGILTASQMVWYNVTTVCSTAGSGSSFTLVCDLTGQTGAVTLVATITYAGQDYQLLSRVLNFGTTVSNFGNTGIIAAIFMVGMGTMAFLVSPFVGVVIFISLVIVSHLLGLIAVGWEFVLSIAFVGFIIAYLVREK